MTSWLSERYETLNSLSSFCDYSGGFVNDSLESRANAMTGSKCQQVMNKLFSRTNPQSGSYCEKQSAVSRSFYHCSAPKEKSVLFGSSQKTMSCNMQGERSHCIPLKNLLFKPVTKTFEKNLETARSTFSMTYASKSIIQNTETCPPSNIPEALLRASSEKILPSQFRDIRVKTESNKSYGPGIIKSPELLESRSNSFIPDECSSSGEDQENRKDQRENSEQREKENESFQIIDMKTKKTPFSFVYMKIQKPDATPTDTVVSPFMIVPILPLPNTGIFALYYILTKQGILSDFSAYSTYKNEMDFNQKEIDATYGQRIDQMREAMEKESSVKRWGVLGKFFSWMASFLGSVSGLILIFSGVGAVMGAGPLAAGLFSLVNSLMEWTGGWNHIAKLLPGNNVAKKRAVISWMKIGISTICLVLSLITCFATGGISQAIRAAQAIPQTIITILMSGFGIAIIGEAVSSFRLFNSVSEIKKTERYLELLYHTRDDLGEKAQSDVDSIENLFDSLSSALDLEREIAQTDDIFYR